MSGSSVVIMKILPSDHRKGYRVLNTCHLIIIRKNQGNQVFLWSVGFCRADGRLREESPRRPRPRTKISLRRSSSPRLTNTSRFSPPVLRFSMTPMRAIGFSCGPISKLYNLHLGTLLGLPISIVCSLLVRILMNSMPLLQYSSRAAMYS